MIYNEVMFKTIVVSIVAQKLKVLNIHVSRNSEASFLPAVQLL